MYYSPFNNNYFIPYGEASGYPCTQLIMTAVILSCIGIYVKIICRAGRLGASDSEKEQGTVKRGLQN
jgi:hypothetical protein